MPRNNQGINSPPPNTQAVGGEIIESAKVNTVIADIYAETNSPRPKAHGGTGTTSDLLFAQDLAANAAAMQELAEGLTQYLLPPGAIQGFAMPAAPAGWLEAGGQAVSRTAYAALFAAFGTLYGVGDGSTTFNIPDYRGRVLIGKDDMGGTAADRITVAGVGVDGKVLGATGGAQNHVLAVTEMPAHGHTGTAASAGAHAHKAGGLNNANGGGAGVYTVTNAGAGSLDFDTSSAGAHTHPVTVTNTGGGLAHPNIQPSAIVLICVKT